MNKTNETLILSESLKWPMIYLINLCTIMTVGSISNLFTLISLPYVRVKYGSKFSILQSSAALLVFHLAFCDLLYCLVGFPHFIQIYLLGYFPYSDTTCWLLGMFRNLIAYADFTTIAVIAVCFCKQVLCKTCRQHGAFTNHSEHDKVFGGFRILGVVFFIWFYSFMCILTPTFNLAGATFEWSGSIFGCNWVSSNAEDLLGFCLFGILTLTIVISYLLITVRLLKDKNENDKLNVLTEKSKKPLFVIGLFITSAFIVFVVPDFIVSKLMSFQILPNNLEIKAIFASMYWWLYGTNFFIYVTANSRLRKAYIKFLKDVFQKGSNVRADISDTFNMQWWSDMKNLPNVSKETKI